MSPPPLPGVRSPVQRPVAPAALALALLAGAMPGFAPAASALPTLTVWGQAVKEGDSGTRNLAFTVTLAPPSDQRVTVQVDTGPASGDTHALTDFSAPGGPDYVPVTARTLTFEPGETQKTVDVPVNGDRMDEPRWERFALHLSNAVNADIETHSAVGYIMDDDPLPELTVRSRTVTEGDSGKRTVSFTAALSAATGQEVFVYFDIGDGTATEGEDYRVPFRPRPRQMIISGKRFQRQGTFEVESLGDTLEEGDKTFRVELWNPRNVVLPDAAITGTITDDDDGTDPMAGVRGRLHGDAPCGARALGRRGAGLAPRLAARAGRGVVRLLARPPGHAARERRRRRAGRARRHAPRRASLVGFGRCGRRLRPRAFRPVPRRAGNGSADGRTGGRGR